jgi:hypothetical protein
MIKADLYDPKLNRADAEMAEHYGLGNYVTDSAAR